MYILTALKLGFADIVVYKQPKADDWIRPRQDDNQTESHSKISLHTKRNNKITN